MCFCYIKILSALYIYIFPFQYAVSRNTKHTQTKSSQKVHACVFLISDHICISLMIFVFLSPTIVSLHILTCMFVFLCHWCDLKGKKTLFSKFKAAAENDRVSMELLADLVDCSPPSALRHPPSSNLDRCPAPPPPLSPIRQSPPPPLSPIRQSPPPPLSPIRQSPPPPLSPIRQSPPPTLSPCCQFSPPLFSPSVEHSTSQQLSPSRKRGRLSLSPSPLPSPLPPPLKRQRMSSQRRPFSDITNVTGDISQVC